jgi:hypothetical protein
MAISFLLRNSTHEERLFLALFLLVFITFAVLLVRPRVEKKEDTGGEREDSSFLIPLFCFFAAKIC